MMAWRTICLLAAAFVLLSTSPAIGQMQWDQSRYIELIVEGQRTYDEAMELPEEAVPRRQELLRESARAKASARRILYFGLTNGAFEDSFDDAINDWFNLSENLIVTLTLLSQCDAAELMIDELEEHRDQLSPDAIAYLENIRGQIEECRTENAPEEAAWDFDRYEQLRNDADVWFSQSEQAGLSSDSQRSLLLESVWRREQSVDLLRITLFTFADAPGLDNPVETLFAQYPALIDGLVQLGFCNAANRRLAQRRVDAQVLGGEPEPPEADLAARVESCRAAQGD